MQNSYTITQDLSYFDHVGLSLYMLPRNKYIKRLLIFIICISVLSALLKVFAPGEQEEVTPFAVSIQLFGPILIVALFFVVVILLLALYVVKVKSKTIRGVSFTFTHWGMERISATSESTIPWRDFQKVKETKRFIILFVKEKNLDNTYAIKKESCKDTAYENELRKFIDINRPL